VTVTIASSIMVAAVVTAIPRRETPNMSDIQTQVTPAIRRTALFFERVASAARTLDNAAALVPICHQSR
jgi:hypothetical protein